MPPQRTVRRWLQQIFCILLLYGLLFLFVFFSGELAAGVQAGVQTALNLVIPSLFVFLIAANLLTHSPAGRIAALPFGFLSRFFRISRESVEIVVLSLLGGYPVGAKLLGDAVRQKRLSADDASRMLCFCVNCGPAFLISGVGAALFGSVKLGWLLYLSQLLACLAVGRVSALGCPRPNCRKKEEASPAFPSFSECFVGGVTDAIRSMAVICGFVVAFAAFLPLFGLLTEQISPRLACLFQGLLEVTTGCAQLADPNIPHRLLLAAGFTSFGGICVLLQVSALLHGTGIRLRPLLIGRLLYTVVSVLSTWGMLLLLPDVQESIHYNRALSQTPWSVSPTAAFFLLLLSVMLLFFRKKSW